MKVEIRNDAVVIDGYVNAVERDSKVLTDRNGQFIEKIKAGTFQRALDRAKATMSPVKVLLNHDYSKMLAKQSDEGTEMREDSIGLRCRCEIRDAGVIDKAKDGKLVGWSFGFIPIRESREDGEITHREIRELELREVSILDDTKIPAYDGTSIEMRDDDIIEIRSIDDDIEVIDNTEPEPKPVDISEFENRYYATLI